MKVNQNNKVLVTGGAGYIGSNIVLKLLQKNYDVVVIDNFSNSYSGAIRGLKKCFPQRLVIYNFNLLNRDLLQKTLKEQHISAIIHMAGKKYVPESFEKEKEYFESNVIMTKTLLDVMSELNIKKLVFSSSITVYGKTKTNIVDEKEILSPVCPYAEQKKECEIMIENWVKVTQSNAIILRLSNPVGANTNFNLGDNSKTKKYKGLLPYIIESANAGRPLVFNGGDHPTKDGTTIRDYIHVEDVASAFVNALELNNKFDVFNIGSGKPGYSVLDILHQTENILGKKINYSFGPKRAGDLSIFVSDNSKAKQLLHFAVSKKLNDMVQSQIKFYNFLELKKQKRLSPKTRTSTL